MELRPYQQTALRICTRCFELDVEKSVIGIPTGGGKTIVFVELMRFFFSHFPDARVVICAHRSELLNQAIQKLDDVWPEHPPIGMVKGTVDEPHEQIVVASIGTIVNPKRRSNLGSFDMLIVDEVHHAPARTWDTVIKAVDAGWVFGFTATPGRSDGEWVPTEFGPLVYLVSTVELIYDGYLSDLRIMKCPDAVDRSAMAVELAEQLVTQNGDQVLIFSESVEDALDQASALLKRGITACAISSYATSEAQARILEAFRSGECKVLCNQALLTEGVDIPCASAAIIARTVGSEPLMGQIVGRILRPQPGKVYSTAWYWPNKTGISPLDGFLGPRFDWLEEGMLVYGETAKEVLLRRWGDPLENGEQSPQRKRDVDSVHDWAIAKYKE